MEKQAHFTSKKLLFGKDIDFPEASGVYKFLNSENEIIYIGKAKNLKNRVKSYLNIRKGEGKRIAKLKSSIKYIETIITKTESDALILEQGLISKIRPIFNIQFRDDKSYPAIHLTTHQDFPAIYVSRQKNKKNTSFGPFANVGAMRLKVNLIRSLFKLRNCKDINFKNRSRPCIEHQMNRCSAPCVGHISKNDYSLDVKNAINFLSGDSKKIIKKLSKQMDFYSEKKDYERAIIYRDRIQSIRDTQKKQNVLTGFDELDILAVRKNKFSACLSVLKVEDGWINSSQNFFPNTSDNISEEELLSVFLESYVVSDKKRKEINLLFQGNISPDTKGFLKNLKFPRINILKPSSKNENLIEICTSQAKDALKRNNNYSWISEALEDLKIFLNLEEINKVEAFDISHTSGKEVSASCVVLDKSGPDKKNYRIMNIRQDSNDDYLALSEAIKRRCKNLQKNNLPLPEVILIDGGKGQLNAAIKALKELNLEEEVTICSLAKKNEEIFIPGFTKSLDTDENQKGVLLLRRVRDEAHRFALSFHRDKRSKRMNRSQLSQISGLGPSRIRELLEHFKSIDAIRIASKEDLSKVKGLGKNSVNDIYEYFNEL